MTTIESRKMLNPYNRSKLLRFEDGSYLPTNKGLNHSSDTKKTIAKNRSNKPKPVELVIKESKVYERIVPLAIRGLAIREIALITMPVFNREQIKNALKRKRPEWHMLTKDYFSPQLVEERRHWKRGPRNKNSLSEAKKLSYENEKKTIAFIHEMWRDGLIPKDSSSWEELHSLYQKNNKTLPENRFDKLRLEIFYSGIERAKKGDSVLLDKYKGIDEMFDSKWFKFLAQEEGFLAAKLLTCWADGEDEKGFFRVIRINGNEEKIRQTEFAEGTIVSYDSKLALKKLRAQFIGNNNGNGNGGNKNKITVH